MEKAMELIRSRMSGQSGRDFWVKLDELASLPELSRLFSREENTGRPGALDISRRSFLKAFAASVAVSGAAGCSSNPDEKALPYVKSPDSEGPYEAAYYSTAVTFAGYAQPVVGKTYAGRPVKLEGNPDHPLTAGATDPFMQAALYGLYDPARSQTPKQNNRETSWGNFERAWVSRLAELDDASGEGLRLLTGHITSPTALRQLALLKKRWPRMRVHRLEVADGESRRGAASMAFDRELDQHLHLDAAETIISFNDDLLGPGPHQAANARKWAERRRGFRAGEGASTLFVAEPIPTLTGSRAQNRLLVSESRIGLLLARFTKALGINVAETQAALTQQEAQWLDLAIASARTNPLRTLITAGSHHSAEVQALAMLANERLGSSGTVLHYSEPIGLSERDPSTGSFGELLEDMEQDRVSHLLIFNCNPAYASPNAREFTEAVKNVDFILHGGLHFDETAQLSTWHTPLQHELETWSDARATDGTVSIIQPLVQPYYDVRSLHAVLSTIAGSPMDGRQIVEETWRNQWGGDFEQRWKDTLIAGYMEASAADPIRPKLFEREVWNAGESSDEDKLRLSIRPDPAIWDGRFSDIGWLQELPKPITKITWGNVVTISPAFALERQISNGDVVWVEGEDGGIAGPAWIMPGQADNTIGLTLGYGRSGGERLADGLGYDAYSMLSPKGSGAPRHVNLSATSEHEELATTQPNQDMGEYAFVRTFERGNPPLEEEPAEELPSFYPRQQWDSPSWGMSIDLDACIGCNACVVACMAENNVPVVGKELVAEGREMHWLRVDHYFAGDDLDPQSHFQPVPCMHCEDAPCEMGCPVNATVHTSDGLNMQVYNRCIGTRTCSSFCPYKVRRFNWFDYTGSDAEEIQAMRNPEVTVRDRGVMEKCSYCVQRISEARIEAKKEGRDIRDGEVRTACQQACPTQAIAFGDVVDPDTEVSKHKAEPRHYTLLKEVNTRPRTTYLARVKATRRRRCRDE
ncbi:4Fe-4S dicluster domain-containing protein [Rhizobium sp. L1K21]|uniref:4Fe-4S dicluster domain-containing protein n=1 Tax=Rhizobium sp. L1K21 TaxID=2954933 RepID=UPI0020924D79|nr:4Fe-4S dicluster domain-containing protein [Rhizobium sp. L1K21]MCO6187787.1 4Fe-4S dicluster domain-containing protein [Rhizobium sp. L1K21]